MTRCRSLVTWLAMLTLTLALALQPAVISADDDDDWESPAVQSDDDDDDWDDDDGASDDDWDDDDSSSNDDWDDDDGRSDDDDRDEDDDVIVLPTREVRDDDDDDDRNDDLPLANQAIVQLTQGTDPGAFADRYGVRVVRQIPAANIVQLELDDLDDDDLEIDEMSTDDDVEWVELNYTSQAPEGRPRYFFTSTDTMTGPADGPLLPEGLAYTPASACVSGANVIVAVLDTGVDASHPDLAGSVLGNGVNFIENSFDTSDAANGLDDDADGVIDEMTGHGTHVAGTILQVAPDAQILPVTVLDSDGVGDTFSLIAGVHYAIEQGADVINLSLGSTYDSRSIRQAVEVALASDVVVIAAAGNSGQQQPPEYPAAIDGVMSVAATSADGDRATYSNFNAMVDLAIPGDGISSTYPGGTYTTASGTSMSTAVGSGAVALVLEREPSRTVDEVGIILTSTTGPLNLSDPAQEGLLGAGEVDIDAAISCAG